MFSAGLWTYRWTHVRWTNHWKSIVQPLCKTKKWSCNQTFHSSFSDSPIPVLLLSVSLRSWSIYILRIGPYELVLIFFYLICTSQDSDEPYKEGRPCSVSYKKENLKKISTANVSNTRRLFSQDLLEICYLGCLWSWENWAEIVLQMWNCEVAELKYLNRWGIGLCLYETSMQYSTYLLVLWLKG